MKYESGRTWMLEWRGEGIHVLVVQGSEEMRIIVDNKNEVIIPSNHWLPLAAALREASDKVYSERNLEEFE